ncbi:MAG TPA: formate dehydrogenase subunit gamma [Acetobacteraceae bacterium]|nr:formate dehydrogenase subunit gamma [Acetobacteraceae bacterium]
MMQVAAAWDEARAAEIIAAHVTMEGAALPILHAMQEAFGCVPPPAVPMIAAALNVTRAEMHGIISFYHDFRDHPPGRRVLKLCQAEACQSMGAVAMAEGLLGDLGIGWGETTADGGLTVEPVYCLGLCACAPSALLDDEPVARLTPQAMTELVERVR